MKSSEPSLTADGLQALNAVCDEFRRQLKAGLSKSGSNVTASPVDVLGAAEELQSSSWLKKFRKDGFGHVQ